MPYDPGISYHGDRYLYEGLANVGTNLAGAFQAYEQQKQQNAFNDQTFDFLAKNVPGSVSPEELERYHGASPKEKQGMVLSAQFAAKQIMDKQKAQDEHILAMAHANYFNRVTRDAARAAKEAGRPIQFDPVVGPDGQAIPGMVVNRKTGQMVYTTPFTNPGGAIVEEDPETGMPFYSDPKGGKHQLDPAKVAAARALRDARPQKTPAPGGKQSTAAPQESDADDKAADIKARYKAGLMSRAQAEEALRQLGYD